MSAFLEDDGSPATLASVTADTSTFTGLPKESAVSFTATDRGSQASLGTMRISDECLPVFGTGS